MLEARETARRRQSLSERTGAMEDDDEFELTEADDAAVGRLRRRALAAASGAPTSAGPSIVVVRATARSTSARAFRPMRDLCEAPDPAPRRCEPRRASARRARTRFSPTRRRSARDPAKPWLLAPIDLQAIKAAGVTFAPRCSSGSSRSARAATRRRRARSATR